MKNFSTLVLLLSNTIFVFGQNQQAIKTKIDQKAASIESKVVAWRRDFHQNPELSNREVRTAQKVAEHLKTLGLEVQTGVGKTGVVGILKGGKPGPVVALRADMDGLPVPERADLPFKSKATGEYNGQTVPVMHACGHDGHTAMLMGAAEVLTSMKNDIRGTVKFIFQPAEEGAPRGEKGGAGFMIEEGALENPKVETIFGLHLRADMEIGQICFRPAGFMASSDAFDIKIKGRQSHGANPWQGIDPVVTSAQIIMGLQTIVSRQTDLTKAAAVVTVGSIHGGVRHNIIPEEVTLSGTIRSLDPKARFEIHEKLKRTVNLIAESAGAKAEITIHVGNPITYNNEILTAAMAPTLQNVAGTDNVFVSQAWTGAEDFALYQEKIPGLFYFLGGKPKGKPSEEVAAHHTPDFYIDEGGFTLGVRSLCYLIVDYPDKKK